MPSLAGLEWVHFRLPGTDVPGYPVPPLRGFLLHRLLLDRLDQQFFASGGAFWQLDQHNRY